MMIKNENQAQKVQMRRFERNKKGYAKAVIRFYKCANPKDHLNH